jgi:hypothetical protein
MTNLRLSLALLLLALISSIDCNTTRFKKIKCTVLNETAVSIDYCYVKVYSRKLSSLNTDIIFHGQWLRPIFVRLL